MAMATQSEAGKTYNLHADTLYSYCTNWNIIGLIRWDDLDPCKRYLDCIMINSSEEEVDKICQDYELLCQGAQGYENPL